MGLIPKLSKHRIKDSDLSRWIASLPVRCRCKNCGVSWRKGEMGDNETICFRCEREEELIDRGLDEDEL